MKLYKLTDKNDRTRNNTQWGENVTVSIKDNGIGIEESRLDQLFHLDSNISTKGTENEKGTGLGLLLCNEFIKKNNGKIWVESKNGDGSTFFFSLPLLKD